MQVLNGRTAQAYDRRLRVLVADPEDERIVAAVRQDARFQLVAVVTDAAALVARTVELAPDVVVADERLPGGAISAAVEIRARMPAVQLLLTYGERGDSLLEAVAAGASAYVKRNARLDKLLETITAVASGEVVLSPAQAADVVAELRDRTRPRRRLAQQPELTAREWQVLELMYNELSTPEIARRLDLSPVTVRSHARSIRRKLERAPQARA